MDPNAAHELTSAFANDVLNAIDSAPNIDAMDTEQLRHAVRQANALAATFLALDEWLRHGGVRPDVWQRRRGS